MLHPLRLFRRSRLIHLPGIAVLTACLALGNTAYGEEAPDAGREVAPTLESILTDLADKEDMQKRQRAAEAALVLQDTKLLRPLTKLLKDDDSHVRLAAIAALGGRMVPADQKKAAQGLMGRLSKSGAKGTEERVAVAEAIGNLKRPETIRPLLKDINLEMPLEEVGARLMAVGHVPNKEAIERLIQFLDKGRRSMGEQKTHAMKALRFATNQSLKRNPDAWRAWWRANKKTFSFVAVQQARDEAEAAQQAAADKKAERKRKQRERKRKRDGDKKAGGKGADDKDAGATN